MMVCSCFPWLHLRKILEITLHAADEKHRQSLHYAQDLMQEFLWGMREIEYQRSILKKSCSLNKLPARYKRVKSTDFFTF